MQGTPEQRKKQKERYRVRTGSGKWRRYWTPEEDELVMKHELSDRELSKKLQRSVTAIQVRRSRLIKLVEESMNIISNNYPVLEHEDIDDWIRDNYFLNYQLDDWEE